MAAKAHEVAPDRGVMIVEKIAPTAVAERGSLLGRADDIGKEHRGEHPVDRTGARAPVKNSSIASAISSALSPTKGMWSVPGSSR
jgi:hypothetical protein